MLRQIGLSLVVLIAAILGTAFYIPAAAPTLERVGLYALLGVEPPQTAQAGGSGFRRGGATRVVVADVGVGTLNDRVTAIGDGRAVRSVSLRADTPGQVTDIAFEAGGYVSEGDVIFRLEDEAEQISLERAQISVEEARRDADRLAQLETTGAITNVALREAEVALRTAELALRQAEFDLDQRLIRAPIDGWIGLIAPDVGDRIDAQDTLATINDRSRIIIEFRMPERVVGDLALGKEVVAIPLARPGDRLSGRISAIDNVVDRASRTLRVQATLDNASDRLRAGMAFSVEIGFEGETYPSIDPLALQWSSDGSFVWAVRDGQATRVAVAIRQRNEDSVLVEADLSRGDQVVIEGVQTLRPGAEVEISNDGALTMPVLPDTRQKT